MKRPQLSLPTGWVKAKLGLPAADWASASQNLTAAAPRPDRFALHPDMDRFPIGHRAK